MAENRGLKTRTAFSNALDSKLLEGFNYLSKKSRIAKSKLLDEAIEDLLKKHKIDLGELEDQEKPK